MGRLRVNPNLDDNETITLSLPPPAPLPQIAQQDGFSATYSKDFTLYSKSMKEESQHAT